MKVHKHISIFALCLTILVQHAYAVESWEFKVFYGDTVIGEHHFNVVENDDNKKVEIKADFNVNIFFINVYSYKHKNIEIWKDSCLNSIESSTSDDGRNFLVEGADDKGTFKIKSNLGYEEVDGCVKTFSYWDKEFLDSEALLNSQTGEYVDVDISFVANEKLLVRNEIIDTKRYEVKTDEFDIDLWYSDKDEWVALHS
ncbi:MAG: DUF6134 family protein, partial [Gammaproteobacteria bacterium]|nr:DUF6134 family protein [Gammaproteobacteria bacterium]